MPASIMKILGKVFSPKFCRLQKNIFYYKFEGQPPVLCRGGQEPIGVADQCGKDLYIVPNVADFIEIQLLQQKMPRMMLKNISLLPRSDRIMG